MRMDWTKSWLTGPRTGQTRQRRVLDQIRAEMVPLYSHFLKPLYPVTLHPRPSMSSMLTYRFWPPNVPLLPQHQWWLTLSRKFLSGSHVPRFPGAQRWFITRKTPAALYPLSFSEISHAEVAVQPLWSRLKWCRWSWLHPSAFYLLGSDRILGLVFGR